MAGRFPGTKPRASFREWSGQLGREIEEALSKLRQGMGILQKTPGIPTQITATSVPSRGTLVQHPPALDDHQHGILTAAPGEVFLADTAALGTGAGLARADHRHDNRPLTRQVALRLVVRQ